MKRLSPFYLSPSPQNIRYATFIHRFRPIALIFLAICFLSPENVNAQNSLWSSSEVFFTSYNSGSAGGTSGCVPTQEVCDGIDNDCDGYTDENLERITSCGTGACAAAGTETCDAGQWTGDTCEVGTPSAETCNNVDDNCDGTIDENLEQATSCGTGACAAAGTETCDAGQWTGDTCEVGTPSAETCGDTIDQDCNGSDLACICGDGTVDIDESCDTGGQSASCETNCTTPICGDGILNIIAGEVCDDGNTVAGDGCNAACTSNETCGNGIQDSEEECDVAGTSSSCDDDCTFAECGDGKINAVAGEECDDGNTNNIDGCSANCIVETCGDGTLNFSGSSLEECDDGNSTNGDGCDNDCSISICINGTEESCYSGPGSTEGVGVCLAGLRTCNDGIWSSCNGEILPTSESCDGLDNDCDGIPDNGLDQDSDTVSDCQDQCSDTATGDAVDQNGCSAAQLNNAPVARNDSFETDEDVAISANVLGNDVDEDNDATVSFDSSNLQAGSTLTDNGAGSFTYTPANNLSGTETFTYTLADNHESSVATVTLTVHPVSDAPVATISGLPGDISNAGDYEVIIGGVGLASFKFALDGTLPTQGEWDSAAEYSAGTTIALNNLNVGPHTLYVVGINAGDRQIEPTVHSWTIDMNPPAVPTLTNVPVGTVSTTSIDIIVGGDDVAMYKYTLDGGITWSQVVTIDSILHEEGFLSGNQYTLLVAGSDSVGNWNPTLESLTWSVDTSTPTAQLSNLPAPLTNEVTSTIHIDSSNVQSYKFSLTGPQGSVYDGTWSQEINVATPINLNLAANGSEDGTYTLRVNARRDTNGVWQDGGTGNNPSTATEYKWTLDTTAPDALSTITALRDNPATSAILLSWAVPEDHLNKYRVWYSTTRITDGDWSQANEIFCGINPTLTGNTETYKLKGLAANTQYYFMVTSTDQAGNESLSSNITSQITAANKPRITALSSTGDDNSVAVGLTVSGENFVKRAGGNIVRFSKPGSVFDLSNTTYSEPQGSFPNMTVNVPAGAPVGEYDLRVINKNGKSLKSSHQESAGATYTITAAPSPLPEVTNIAPAVAGNNQDVTVVISGNNFQGDSAVVELVPVNGGPAIPLSAVTVNNKNVRHLLLL